MIKQLFRAIVEPIICLQQAKTQLYLVVKQFAITTLEHIPITCHGKHNPFHGKSPE
jgi:hypothetical protein